MIDVENEVYTIVATAVRSAFPGIEISGGDVDEIASFPSLTFGEADQSTPPEAVTSGPAHRLVDVMYEANVYSNLQTGAKSQVKEIMSVVHDTMVDLGFRLQTLTHPPNFADRSIHRALARFTGQVDINRTIYSRR